MMSGSEISCLKVRALSGTFRREDATPRARYPLNWASVRRFHPAVFTRPAETLTAIGRPEFPQKWPDCGEQAGAATIPRAELAPGAGTSSSPYR